MPEKYIFDHKSHRFVPYQWGWKEWIWYGLVGISLMMGGAALTIYAFSRYVDTPEERMLRHKVLSYQIEVEKLQQRVEDLSAVVASLQEKDEKIYRVIFEAPPISKDVREGGFGGAPRYAELRSIDESGSVANLAQKVDQLSSQLYLLTKSYNEISNLARKKEDWARHKPVIMPIPGNKIKRFASGFGYRIHPFYKIRKFHKGVDFSARRGTPVYATGDGVVQMVKRSRKGYGNMIIIDHGYGYKTLYAHLWKFNVRPGQKVRRGDVIGYVGSTGLSMAPHLHYEVHKNGQPVNPIYYFHNDLTPDEYAELIEKDRQTHQSFD